MARATVRCELGDITRAAVDAVVNAANPALRGGGGVDGAIHRAAGPALLKELVERYPEGCSTGEARITRGHGLPARWIVHTPGPVWSGGHRNEADLLASCHRNAIRAAAECGCRSVAFPAISCGVYRYPPELAAPIAIDAVRHTIINLPDIEVVRFVLFSPELLDLFAATLASSDIGQS